MTYCSNHKYIYIKLALYDSFYMLVCFYYAEETLAASQVRTRTSEEKLTPRVVGTESPLSVPTVQLAWSAWPSSASVSLYQSGPVHSRWYVSGTLVAWHLCGVVLSVPATIAGYISSVWNAPLTGNIFILRRLNSSPFSMMNCNAWNNKSDASEKIQRIVVPRSATNLTLKKVKGHRQGHDMVPPERSCHKEHTCQVSKLYL